MRSRSFRFAFLFTLVLLPVLGISGAAQAVPSRTVVITPTSGAQSWTGDTATVGLGPGATVNVAPGGAQVTPGEHIAGIEFTNSRPLIDGPVGPVPVFFADDEFGCQWTAAAASGIPEWIGLARRGLTAPPPGTDLCPGFQNKFNAATAAGADGLIVINFDDTTTAGTAAATIPGVMVTLSDGNRLKNSLVPGNPQQVKVTLCVDGPCVTTAVSIRGFAARWNGSRVVVSWTTASEVDALGFNVFRRVGKGPFRKINFALIPAKRAGSARGAAYRLVDRTVRRSQTYTYRLQIVAKNGKRSWYGIGSTATRF
jgi:hypothetical protein